MTASELFRETGGAPALAAVIGALFGLLVTVANPLAINEYEDGSAVVCIGSQPMAVRVPRGRSGSRHQTTQPAAERGRSNMSARDELFTYLTAHPFATDAEVSRDTGLTVLQIKRLTST